MIYVVIGRRELGKTTLAYWMARRLKRRAIIDPRQMIKQRSIHVEYASHAALADEALNAMMAGESEEVIYQPREDDIEEAFVQWTRSLKALVVAMPESELAIMVDEASFYRLETPTFQWLCKCSLRDYTHIIITAHQPKDIPTSIRAIADHWFVFYTTQETDLAKIAEKSPEAAREARKLHDRGYVHWDDTRAKLSINNQASSWFVELRDRGTMTRAHIAPADAAIVKPSSLPLLDKVDHHG